MCILSRLLIYISIPILFFPNSSAQSLSFRLGINYSDFNMSELKDVQSTISSSIKSYLPIRDLETFPAYYVYDIQLMFVKMIPIDVGFSASYMSTGGRSYYSDYSGTYNIDYLVNASTIAINLEKMVLDSDIDLLIGTKLMLISTDFTLDENIRVEYETDSNSIETTSNSFGLTLSGALQYELSSFLFRVNLGYLFDFQDDLHKVGDPDDYLITRGAEKVSADWSGVFIGFALGYNIELE